MRPVGYTPSSAMPARPPATRSAFRALENALLRRRLEALDPLLRLELVLLGALVCGFVFWQSRLALAAAGDATALATRLALLALLGASLAAGRHGHVLRHGLPGPHWAALPVAPREILAHHGRVSRRHALWVVPPGLALLAAALGIVAPPVLAGCALGFGVALWGAAGLAVAAIGWRAALVAGGPDRALPPGVAPRTDPAPRLPPARFRAGGAVAALLRKDLLASTRAGRPRERLLAALPVAVLAAAVWALPRGAGASRPALALALALVAAALLGRWVLALADDDPFPLVRPLPLAAHHVWRARAAWVVLAAAALVALQLPALAPLDLSAWALMAAWIAVAASMVVLLAVHYAITLHPNLEQAERIYSLALLVAASTSVVLPLAGWAMLLAALLHSARRVPRWIRPEGA